MLGWFKKKFKKKDDDAAQAAADLKIPVAPRTFGPPAVEEEEQLPALEKSPEEGAFEESYEPAEEDREIPQPELPEEEVSAAPESLSEELLDIEEEQPEEPQPEPEHFEEPPALQTEIDEQTQEDDEDLTILEGIGEELITSDVEPTDVEEVLDLDQAPMVEEELPEERAVPPAASTAGYAREQDKPAPKKKSFLSRLSDRLSRTRESFTYQLDTLFLGRKEIDGRLLDDLEELLITADLGINVTGEILDYARRKVKRKELSDPKSLKLVLKDKLQSFIEESQEDASLVMPKEGPFVIMVVGVNGVGKTTTIGKIAHKFLRSGQSVLLVAADTFRAAAVSQLKIWGERNKVPVIAKEEGADPSAVVFDGLAHAKSKEYDVVLVDTAGRLHTQANLMEELKKIKRVMTKQLPGAPHEVMLVIDATTGQNGISQAKLFDAAVDITGITLTKLDGTAKGGIVINICRELKTPIRFIGVGEQLDDLRDFDPDEFIEALFQGPGEAAA